MKYIAYYRVSTQRQGQSGLGLQAQRETVLRFTNCPKGSCIECEYVEIESGKTSEREQLNQAIAHAKKTSYKLIIAKLDRLSRDVEFIFKLKNSDVDFVACDIPDANTLTIGIFATMAQFERERISQRTKEALAVIKSRGKQLGSPQNLTEDAKAKARESIIRRSKEDKAIQLAKGYIQSLRKEGKTYRQIAELLNASGYKTRKGKAFTPIQVQRIVKRFEVPREYVDR